jgi:hypothetical protein
LYYKNSKSSSEIKFICNFFQIEGIYDFTLDKNNQINTVIRNEEPESEDKQGKKQNEIIKCSIRKNHFYLFNIFISILGTLI